MFYFACRYYSQALDDAKFVASLMEGLDDDEDEYMSRVTSNKVNR